VSGRGGYVDFLGGIGKSLTDSLGCEIKSAGFVFLAGLTGRRPADTMAAFSSSWVGSLIGDGTRGDCSGDDSFLVLSSHNEVALLTELTGRGSIACFGELSLEEKPNRWTGQFTLSSKGYYIAPMLAWNKRLC
jgi:hypothetical protein